MSRPMGRYSAKVNIHAEMALLFFQVASWWKIRTLMLARREKGRHDVSTRAPLARRDH